jgi:Cft2 family RNA processing exonuclease
MDIFNEGGDLERFIWEYLEFLRLCILIHKGIKDKDILGLLGDDIEKISNLVQNVPFEKLFVIFDEVYQLKSKSYFLRIKNSYEARILIEVTLLKIQDKLSKPALDEIIHDINQLTKLFEGKDISEERLFRDSTIQYDAKKKSLEDKTENSAIKTKKEVENYSNPQEKQKKELLNLLNTGDNKQILKQKDFSLEDEIQAKFLGTYITDEDKIPKLPNN